MAKDMNGVEVNIGDRITVAARGIRVTGVVVSVNYYGPDSDGGWQIELDEANVPGGWSSWKQRQDGGCITEVNGSQV